MNTPEIIAANALWRILNGAHDPVEIARETLVRMGAASPKQVAK